MGKVFYFFIIECTEIFVILHPEDKLRIRR